MHLIKYLLYQAVLAALVSSFTTRAASPVVMPYHNVTRKFTSGIIVASSRSQELTVIDVVVDHSVDYPAFVWMLPPRSSNVNSLYLFAYLKVPHGATQSLKWHIKKTKLKSIDVRWMVIDDFSLLKPGSILEIGIWTHVNQHDGYFVGFEDGIQERDNIDDFSGCFRVAVGVPFAMQHNNGVTVTKMASPGQGFRGWCYRYRSLPGKPDYYLHYFAASSAKSWHDVAAWYRRAFTKVTSHRYGKRKDIVAQLGLRQTNVSDIVKISRIRKWMSLHLRYSGKDTYAHVPPSFDRVVQDGFGECKGLTLVMLELLHAGGIRAHLILTSTKTHWAFVGNSSRFSYINHVAIYLPGLDAFLDPTVEQGAGLVGYQAMDVETGQVMTIR